uniref:ATP synthase F0 subunit 8 n=1 Tax=Channa pulchra TaxID=1500737 RepID=UPI0023AAD8C9|nr:ATP synthase F0 subunit 8 [Channa pulchra]WCJ52941.1 ATP synthase F0 subunit 8 [Channa pulchra]
MPQLNPSPWLAILIISWLTFATIVLPKILTHTFPNILSSLSTNPILAEPWNWPWF